MRYSVQLAAASEAETGKGEAEQRDGGGFGHARPRQCTQYMGCLDPALDSICDRIRSCKPNIEVEPDGEYPVENSRGGMRCRRTTSGRAAIANLRSAVPHLSELNWHVRRLPPMVRRHRLVVVFPCGWWERSIPTSELAPTALIAVTRFCLLFAPTSRRCQFKIAP